MQIITHRMHPRYFKWQQAVFKRDNHTCQDCGAQEKLHAHHIKTWDEAPKLRTSVKNGLTLCSACHMKVHSKGRPIWNKGLAFSEEHKAKLSAARKGREPWNKGLKGAQIAWNKGEKLSSAHREKAIKNLALRWAHKKEDNFAQA